MLGIYVERQSSSLNLIRFSKWTFSTSTFIRRCISITLLNCRNVHFDQRDQLHTKINVRTRKFLSLIFSCLSLYLLFSPLFVLFERSFNICVTLSWLLPFKRTCGGTIWASLSSFRTGYLGHDNHLVKSTLFAMY